MAVSGSFSVLPPDVSGALRYERIAQFEAVLKVKEKKSRAMLVRTLTIAGLVAAAVCTLWLIQA